jgi:outer membrane protein assembly factor BamA
LINGSAPFHKLAALGGQSMMRGYYEGRYLGNKLLAGQVEYRIPIYWRFGAVAFAGAGDVASTMSRFNLHDLKPSYGFGIRYVFNPDEKLSLRLDFGFGRNTSGVYITAAEAF